MKRGQRIYVYKKPAHYWYDYLEDNFIYERPAKAWIGIAQQGPADDVLRKKVSKGMKVRLLQKFLKIHVDGDFGNDTEAAVIAWQNKNGLKPTGTVDRATWDKMVPPNDLTHGIDVLRSIGNPNDNTHLHGFEGALYVDEKEPSSPVVYIYVEDMWLNYEQYLIDEAAKKRAAKAIASEQLPETTVESADARWEPKPGDSKIITTPMEIGSKGLEVESLQEFLQIEGLVKRYPDGDYGSGTEKAVRAWQKKKGLPQTGKADKATLEQMNIPAVKLIDQPMKPGDEGMPVHMLQRFLEKNGLWAKKPNGKPVKFTSDYDKNTKAGVLFWQKSQGLPETGIVDKETLEKMQLRYPNFDETYKDAPPIKGSTYSKQKYNYNMSINLNNALLTQYKPALERLYPKISKGFKALMIAMTHMEGFSKDDKNPGNINNTDKKSTTFPSLDTGIKAQYNHIVAVANGQEKNYPIGKRFIMKPFYSPEMADYIHSYKKSPYVPGYDFIYTGQLDQFVKIYAVAPRSGNNYINTILSYFKKVGLSITPETTIKQMINMK